MAAAVISFSCRSQTDWPDGGTDIATLVRCALAEVCTVSQCFCNFCVYIKPYEIYFDIITYSCHTFRQLSV